jgi:hypothetical protein
MGGLDCSAMNYDLDLTDNGSFLCSEHTLTLIF